MKSQLLFMLKIISAVISGSALPDMVENVDWNILYDISAMHNITNIIGYAAMSGKYSMDEEIKQKFIKSVSEYIRIDAVQEQKSKELFERFDKEHIDYMPLKGINLKKLYPTGDLRKMTDMDILIKEEQRDAISGIMQDLGYEFGTESDHEIIYFSRPFVCVELHKRMVPHIMKIYTNTMEMVGNWQYPRKAAGVICFQKKMSLFT